MLSENEYTPNEEVFTLYMRRYARNHIPAPQPPQQPASPSNPPNLRVSDANQKDNKDDESSDSDEPPSY